MKLAMAVVGLVLVGLAWWLFSSHVVSPEEAVRERIYETAASFDDGDVSDVMAAFTEDWRDRTGGLGRDELHDALLYALVLLRQRGRVLTAMVDPDSVVVELGAEEKSAQAHFEVTLGERHDDEVRPVWKVAVDADLVLQEGEWRFASSSHRTLSGHPPG